MVVGRDAILAGSPKFSGAVQVRLKKDVKNNGASPDKGKTRLNPTYAHTQGVSGAAGLLFRYKSTIDRALKRIRICRRMAYIGPILRELQINQ